MKLFIILILATISTSAFAHGEDKYGPNKGYIRMPGPFHTEIVPADDGSYRVYLMDVLNKKPTTKDSSITFQIKNADKVIAFECKPQDNFYTCGSSEKKIAQGQIILTAKRLGIQGKPALYDLPLKLKMKNEGSEDHGKHN